MKTQYPAPILIVSLILLCTAAGSVVAQEGIVVESVICRAIVERMPVDPTRVIPADAGTVFCFTHIEGAAEETEITHNWYHQGNLKASVVLPVRNRSWRTWSSKALLPEWTGEWMVEILAKDGTPLENLIFHVR